MTSVALITRDTAFGRHMAARLAHMLAEGGTPLGAILVLRGAAPAPRRNGLIRALRLRALRRLVSARARQAHQLWKLQHEADAEFARRAGPVPGWPDGIALRHSEDRQVNTPDTIGWLRGIAPRLLVVAGSPILGAELLAVPQEGTLNMHSSLLPRYRGTRAEFWQVHNDDLDCAGITIHFVDTSVDGGDILRHHPQDATPADGPWLMRARNQLNGLRVYPETVRAVLEGRATRQPQPASDERAYRYSDITPEATRRVLRKLRAARGDDAQT